MEIRLQKLLTMAGVASRRKVDEMISSGRISVNGVIVREFGIRATHADTICLDGVPIAASVAEKTYILFHKPIGVVTTASDPAGRPTVMDFMPGGVRLFSVGRLDFDSSGLLLLTNDGDWAYKLTHPKHEIGKTYVANIRGMPSEEALGEIRNGVVIDGRLTAPCVVDIMSTEPAKLRVTIHEGRNRQIRKMFENIGHPVMSLRRIAVGNLSLGSLPCGKWRHLTPEEVTGIANS